MTRQPDVPDTCTSDSGVIVDGLRVVRGGRAVLPSLSCSVLRGTVTGLIGPSGCGKTTLLRAIVGVQIIAGGSITVLGRPAGSTILRGRIGYATQNPSVYSDLSVRDNLRYFAAVLRAPASDVDRVVAEVGLQSRAAARVAELSGGERSRTSLAAALLGSPDLLVLDEPTVGLDPVLRGELWRLFHDLAGRGLTLLVSSHVMDEAGRCDRLMLMREGGLLADDTPSGVRERTGKDDLEAAFLQLIGEQVPS